MKSKPKAPGSFLLILGLIIYQFGLLATLQQAALIGYLRAFLSIEIIELMGVLLQLLGGFLIVAGLNSLVSGTIAIQLENELRNLYEILSRVDKKISDMSDMMARQRLNKGPQTQQAARICKFCGTQLGDEDVFCPTCGKSQK
jgi:hypothetical protein